MSSINFTWSVLEYFDPYENVVIYIFSYFLKCIESNVFQYGLSFWHSQNIGIATIFPNLWAPAPTKLYLLIIFFTEIQRIDRQKRTGNFLFFECFWIICFWLFSCKYTFKCNRIIAKKISGHALCSSLLELCVGSLK